MREIDEHEISFLLDQLIVVALMAGESNRKYIDDVL